MSKNCLVFIFMFVLSFNETSEDVGICSSRSVLSLQICRLVRAVVTPSFAVGRPRFNSLMVVEILDPFRRMGAWRNSTKTQQSGHAQRSGPEVKNGS